LWSAAHVQDFEAFQNAVAAATIDNIIESTCKGQRGVDLVNAFVKIYMPIFEMLQAFLIKAFGNRLPTEDELERVLNSVRGAFRLGECHVQDGAVAGNAAYESVRGNMQTQLSELASDIRTVLSPTRVTEIQNATQPGWRGKAWSSYYAVRDYAKGGFRRRRVVVDDDDDDCGPSKRLRAGEGMPSAAENDPSCKYLEPHGSTDPRAGVWRTNLLADIANHARRNAVHQIDFSNL